MNSPQPDHPASIPAAFGRAGLGYAAAALAVTLVAISGRSFWIDEAATAVQTMQPTLAAWWQLLVQVKTAFLQMPFYMLYMWAYAQLCGSGEWTLRLANLPWFVAGATAFILSFPRGEGRRPIAACIALLCPFAWYYLDEMRPYAMQLGVSLLMVASLARLDRDSAMGEARDAVHLAVFLFGVVVLSGFSIIGMVWASAALLVLPALLPWSRVSGLVKRFWYLWLAAGGILFSLGCYYLWTLSVGARASTAVTTTLGSASFVGYELLGFSGLGPGRLALRSAGPAELRPYLVWLALYAILIAILIGAALRHLLQGGNRRHLAVAFCCCLPAAFLLTYGWVVHFRVLGRHCTPFVAVLMLLLTLGCSVTWARRSAWARGVVLLFFALSLVSCLSLRFLARHEKDDYRTAAALAKTALRNRQSVWWNAAPEGALYYTLPISPRPGASNEAFFVWNPTRQTLMGLTPPQIIIASKPDIYDGEKAVAEYIREHGYQPRASLPAFVIWRRGGN